MRMRDFDIVFSGLNLGKHQFNYALNDTFFEFFEYDSHHGLQGTATVILEKHNTFLELDFAFDGEIEVICDRSGMPFLQKLKDNFRLLVKFGEAFDDTDDENLILPQGEYQLNVAQYLYELVVLAIPAKNIHPDVKSGKIAPNIQPEKTNKTTIENTEADPRWAKLKDLLN